MEASRVVCKWEGNFGIMSGSTAGKELTYPRDFRNVEELCTAAEDISLTRDFAGEGGATDPEFVLAAGEKLLSTRFEHREELIFC